jgi:UDP-3-O-[3-hydroxymyristoyl] glucosamine N-acyltransferase
MYCIIEDEVTIWGQVGTARNHNWEKLSFGQTGVTKSVEGGKVILEPHRRVQRKVKATSILKKTWDFK